MTVGKTAEKWKQKKWYNLHAPKIFEEAVVGEVPASDDAGMVGRVIKVNMSWITHRPEHSFITVAFKVNEASGEVAHTDISYVEQTYSYLHSLVKRRQSVIYTVDKLKDKEGKSFVLKLLVLTRSKVATPKKTAIRKTLSDFTKEYAAGLTTDELIKNLLDNKFQAEAANKVANIAEIGRLELKKIVL